MTINKDTGQGEYPKTDWDFEFQNFDVPPAVPLFDFSTLSTVKPPAKDIAQGLKTLKTYETNRTQQQRDDIMREAEPAFPAIRSVLVALGISYPSGGEIDAVMQTVLLNIRYPVFWWKAKYERARPRMKAKELGVVLNPMLGPGSGYHPGHGSYPSGHAALVHCWAELLGELLRDPAKKAAAHVAAGVVANNREIAGVHFPSDTTAGQVLGLEIAKAIIAADRLTKRQIKILLNN